MCRFVALLVLTLVSPALASAQPIHEHPQKSVYANPSEWPLISSQCHWMPSEGTDPKIGHLHVEVFPPIYAEVGHAVTMNFQIQLFRIAGRIVEPWLFGNLARNIVWDATGAETPPDLTGDPNGLKVWTGHLTMDPFIVSDADGSQVVPAHGWFQSRFFSRVFLDNGDTLDNELYVPFFSVIDPSAPLSWNVPHPFRVMARCTPRSARDGHGPNVPGTSSTEVLDFIPLAPISRPVAIGSQTYNYAGDEQLPTLSFYEQHLDPDYHHDNPGTTLQHNDGGVSNQTLQIDMIDPATFGAGDHKNMHLWTQPTGDGVPGAVAPNEQASSIIVYNVTIDANAPPTPALTEPADAEQPDPIPPPPPGPPDLSLLSGPPATVVAGDTFSVMFHVLNTTDETWLAATSPLAGPGDVENRWELRSRRPVDNWIWGTPRVSLPQDLAPGESVDVRYAFTAPSVPGTYLFAWQMMWESVNAGFEVLVSQPVHVVGATTP